MEVSGLCGTEVLGVFESLMAKGEHGEIIFGFGVVCAVGCVG